MIYSRLTFPALLSSLAITQAAVPYLQITSLVVSDISVPVESHHISYTVSTPGAVYKQGYSDPFNVSISWDGCEPPTCWSPSANFFSRVHPESYRGGNDFKLEVSKSWFYRSPSLFPSTLDIVEGSTSGYDCDEAQGSSDRTCTLDAEKGLTAPWNVKYWGEAVMPSPVC